MTYLIDKVFVPAKLTEFLAFAKKLSIPVVATLLHPSGEHEPFNITTDFAFIKVDKNLEFYKVGAGNDSNPYFVIEPDRKVGPSGYRTLRYLAGLSSNPWETDNPLSFHINARGDLYIHDPELLRIWQELPIEDDQSF